MTELLEVSIEVEFANYPEEVWPDLALRLEVLRRGISDAIGILEPGLSPRQERDAVDDGRKWLCSNNRGSMTFIDICESLDLPCENVRHQITLVMQGELSIGSGRSSSGLNMERLFG